MPWWHNLYFNPLYSLYIYSLYIHLYLSIFIQWFMIGFSLVWLFCHWHLLSFLWTKDADSVTIEIGSCQLYKDFCPCAADCSACLRFSSMVCWGLVVYVSIASWENEQLHAAGIWIKFTLKDHLFQSKSGLQRWTLNSRGKMLLKNSADVVSWLLNNKNKSAKNHESTNLFLWSIRYVGFSLEPTTSWDFSAF